MSRPVKYQSPYERLSAIYEAICAAAMCNPWEREPYAVIRREKRSGGTTNLIPNYKAYRMACWLDGRMGELAADAAERVGMRLKTDLLPSGYKRLTVMYRVVTDGEDVRWIKNRMTYLARDAVDRADCLYNPKVLEVEQAKHSSSTIRKTENTP